MSDFDWTAYILYKQVSALKEELDKIDIPIIHGQVASAKGPAIAFNNLLPKVKTLLANYASFSGSIDDLEEYENPSSSIATGKASQLRVDVGVLLETLGALIQATYPPEEKQKVGFV